MNRLSQGLAVLSLLGFVSAFAMAEPPKSTDPNKPDPAAKKKCQYDGQYCGLRSSTIIGSNVKNPEGNDLGSIEDLAVDPDSGRVIYGVLSFGGFLGMGDKLFAIPLSSLDFNHDGFVELDVDKTTLESAEGFNKDNWPDMANERWATETHTRYGQKPYWQSQTGQPGDGQGMIERRPTRIVRASETMGKDVKNASNEKIGNVEDIMVDASQGKIAYVVVDCAGYLETENKLVAVPWSKLQVPSADEIRLNMDKNTLAAAPKVKENNWPARENKDLLIEVYSHYDVNPYWDTNRGKTSDM